MLLVFGPDHVVQMTKVNCRLKVSCANVQKYFTIQPRGAMRLKFGQNDVLMTHEYIILLKFQPLSFSVSKVENRYNSLSAYNSLVHDLALYSIER